MLGWNWSWGLENMGVGFELGLVFGEKLWFGLGKNGIGVGKKGGRVWFGKSWSWGWQKLANPNPNLNLNPNLNPNPNPSFPQTQP